LVYTFFNLYFFLFFSIFGTASNGIISYKNLKNKKKRHKSSKIYLYRNKFFLQENGRIIALDSQNQEKSL